MESSSLIPIPHSSFLIPNSSLKSHVRRTDSAVDATALVGIVAIYANGFRLCACGGNLNRAAVEGKVAFDLDAAALGFQQGIAGHIRCARHGHVNERRGRGGLSDEQVAAYADALCAEAADVGLDGAARDGHCAVALHTLGVVASYVERERAAFDEHLAIERVGGIVRDGHIHVVASDVGEGEGASLHLKVLLYVKAVAGSLCHLHLSECGFELRVFVGSVGVLGVACEHECACAFKLSVTIDKEAGFTTSLLIDGDVKRAVIKSSKECYILADKSKFNIRRFYTYGNFNEGTVITDSKIDFNCDGLDIIY